jgi:hypothetical protein
MSLVGDVLTQLEVELRLVVPSLPAGVLGVEQGWRPASQIVAGEFPHVFLYNEAEQQEALIFRQVRSTVTVTGLIVRRDSMHAQLLTDYGGLAASIEADQTVNGVLEQSRVQLDGIEHEEGKGLYVCAFTFTGVKVSS